MTLPLELHVAHTGIELLAVSMRMMVAGVLYSRFLRVPTTLHALLVTVFIAQAVFGVAHALGGLFGASSEWMRATWGGVAIVMPAAVLIATLTRLGTVAACAATVAWTTVTFVLSPLPETALWMVPLPRPMDAAIVAMWVAAGVSAARSAIVRLQLPEVWRVTVGLEITIHIAMAGFSVVMFDFAFFAAHFGMLLSVALWAMTLMASNEPIQDHPNAYFEERAKALGPEFYETLEEMRKAVDR